MSHQMRSNLAQWVFDIFREVRARRSLSPKEGRLMDSLQTGYTSFTPEAYDQILDIIKERMSWKDLLQFPKKAPDQFKVTVALISTLHGMECDGVQLARYFKDEWDIVADWHWFSNALDAMHTKGLVEIVSPGGFTIYRVL